MGTISKTQNIGFAQNNDTYTIEVDLVENLGQNLIHDVVVTLTIPAGISYTSSVLDKGVYVGGPNEWQVGTVLPGETVTGTFTFTITDESLIPFAHSFVVTVGSGCNSCITNDTLNVTVTGVSCSNVQSCLANLPAYDDDTAAGVGGLVAGDLYQTTGSGSAPLNIAGLIKIVQ